ncbi:GNAT family N-acetyltransferase [Gallaecimonas kandeliae]|uniref:GNAT family N-acetyltransferase n=1 Tax=Gallaecimonas kandeliae TaxID=3029055 RepID=UPI002647CEE1|nr:GNAT family N-acetyltransferase [Gallaecimonas kandeliae]WKE65194.1 GNAT family N-acetyltransferase [Gallaecimonas kandeliae]
MDLASREQELCWLSEGVLPQGEAWIFDDGEVRGAMLLGENQLYGFCVAPGARGRGIGSALLAFAQVQRDLLRLCPYVQQQGIAFLRRRGFRTIAKQLDERSGRPRLMMVAAPSQGYFSG